MIIDQDLSVTVASMQGLNSPQHLRMLPDVAYHSRYGVVSVSREIHLCFWDNTFYVWCITSITDTNLRPFTGIKDAQF